MKTVGRYELIRELGEGGMGRVHLAHEPGLRRDVALKELTGLVGGPEATARFLREAQVAASLSHPNIVTIFDYFEIAGVPYIAMEYLSGGSLRSHLAGLDLAGLATVMEGVLAGLAHAHDSGVVHRDLKPENILVTSEGVVKICDFGLAKAAELTTVGAAATRTGAILGTPQYMAPEQALGGEVGVWSDLYAIGVIAHEQLGGRLPFPSDEGPLAILMRHAHEGFPSLLRVRPDLDPELAAWVDKLLTIDPSERVRDPRDAWDRLEQIVVRMLDPRWRRAGRLNRSQAHQSISPTAQSEPTIVSVQWDLNGPSRVDHPVGKVTLLAMELARPLPSLLAGRADKRRIGRSLELLRPVWAAHNGIEVDPTRASALIAFESAQHALDAAAESQCALTTVGENPRQSQARIAIHTGVLQRRDGLYWGVDARYAERLCSAANVGQVLISAETRVLISEARIDDLGERALPDFPKARRIFHLIIDGRQQHDFDSIPARRPGETNLPDQISSFVGRQHELAVLRELVSNHRLISLVGAGGVGKTRLALRLGAELLDGSGDGVWLTELAPIIDPEAVGSTIANALGLAERPDQTAVQTLISTISDREMLLIVDNCEHLIDPARKIVGELLRHCPGLAVIVTSRQPLGIDGEQVYRVPSLSLPMGEDPQSEAVERSEAVQLFIERARQQRPDFALTDENARPIARICRRLDGIALAIELAAVRIRSLSVTELEGRLNQRLRLLRNDAGGEVVPRQRTLEALVEWSYQLLSEQEQITLAQLSTFAASGFDLSAAEAVCTTDQHDGIDVINHLDGLVDKSLVQAEDTAAAIRYRLLETIREFAGRQLAESAGDSIAARTAHRNHYLQFAEAAQPHLHGPDAALYLDRLELEHDNLRGALAYCLEDPDPAPGLRLAKALRTFWQQRGFAAEGARTLDEHLRRPGAQKPTRERCSALAARGLMQQVVPLDASLALAHAEEALDIAHKLDSEELSASALRALTIAFTFAGQHERAGQVAQEGLELARKTGDWLVQLSFVNARGVAALGRGDDARPAILEAIEIARLHGDRFDEGVALANLALTEINDDAFDGARTYLDQALEIFFEFRDPSARLWVAAVRALVCCCEQEWSRAVELFSEILLSATRLGEDSIVALGLTGLGITAPDVGTSAMLFGAVAAIHERLGDSFDATEHRAFDQHLDAVRQALGPDRYAEALDRGRRLARRDAIDLALRSVPATNAKPSYL